MKHFFVDSFEGYIGSNIIENDEMFNRALDNDIWFHIYSFPSAHMWIKGDRGVPDKNTLYKIGLELKKRSKYKKISGLPIIYTTKKNLTKTQSVGSLLIKGPSKIITI